MTSLDTVKDLAILEALTVFLEDRQLQADKVKLTRMAGFSNEIYKVELRDKTLIVKKKVPEKKTAKFVVFEETIKKIVKDNHFGPSTFFENEKVIIEEFLTGDMLTITETHSFRYIFKSIDEVVRFNQMKITPLDRAALNNEPLLLDLLKRGVRQDAVNNLKQNLESCVDVGRRAQVKAILGLLEDKVEMDWVVGAASKHNKNLVLNHNDFYRLNLLKDPLTDQVALIDYEYAALNPLAWDVVNSFCERCFCYDEEKNKFGLDLNIPRSEQRRVVFRYYLLRLSQLSTADFPVVLNLEDEHLLADLSSDKFDKFLDTGLLTHLVEDFYEIMAVINYCWILWCAVLVSDHEERWPVVDYTLKRMALQDYLRSKVSTSVQSS